MGPRRGAAGEEQIRSYIDLVLDDTIRAPALPPRGRGDPAPRGRGDPAAQATASAPRTLGLTRPSGPRWRRRRRGAAPRRRGGGANQELH